MMIDTRMSTSAAGASKTTKSPPSSPSSSTTSSPSSSLKRHNIPIVGTTESLIRLQPASSCIGGGEGSGSISSSISHCLLSKDNRNNPAATTTIKSAMTTATDCRSPTRSNSDSSSSCSSTSDSYNISNINNNDVNNKINHPCYLNQQNDTTTHQQPPAIPQRQRMTVLNNIVVSSLTLKQPRRHPSISSFEQDPKRQQQQQQQPQPPSPPKQQQPPSISKGQQPAEGMTTATTRGSALVSSLTLKQPKRHSSISDLVGNEFSADSHEIDDMTTTTTAEPPVTAGHNHTIGDADTEVKDSTESSTIENKRAQSLEAKTASSFQGTPTQSPLRDISMSLRSLGATAAGGGGGGAAAVAAVSSSTHLSPAPILRSRSHGSGTGFQQQQRQYQQRPGQFRTYASVVATTLTPASPLSSVVATVEQEQQEQYNYSRTGRRGGSCRAPPRRTCSLDLDPHIHNNVVGSCIVGTDLDISPRRPRGGRRPRVDLGGGIVGVGVGGPLSSSPTGGGGVEMNKNAERQRQQRNLFFDLPLTSPARQFKGSAKSSPSSPSPDTRAPATTTTAATGATTTAPAAAAGARLLGRVPLGDSGGGGSVRSSPRCVTSQGIARSNSFDDGAIQLSGGSGGSSGGGVASISQSDSAPRLPTRRRRQDSTTPTHTVSTTPSIGDKSSNTKNFTWGNSSATEMSPDIAPTLPVFCRSFRNSSSGSMKPEKKSVRFDVCSKQYTYPAVCNELRPQCYYSSTELSEMKMKAKEQALTLCNKTAFGSQAEMSILTLHRWKVPALQLASQVQNKIPNNAIRRDGGKENDKKSTEQPPQYQDVKLMTLEQALESLSQVLHDIELEDYVFEPDQQGEVQPDATAVSEEGEGNNEFLAKVNDQVKGEAQDHDDGENLEEHESVCSSTSDHEDKTNDSTALPGPYDASSVASATSRDSGSCSSRRSRPSSPKTMRGLESFICSYVSRHRKWLVRKALGEQATLKREGYYDSYHPTAQLHLKEWCSENTACSARFARYLGMMDENNVKRLHRHESFDEALLQQREYCQQNQNTLLKARRASSAQALWPTVASTTSHDCHSDVSDDSESTYASLASLT